jgi:methylenetetrahydrofolate dehydrogenase (NADP+)/methenyltetrahydrofolate cyclohydrolase
MKEIKTYVDEKFTQISDSISKLSSKPKLVILNIGNDLASQAYIRGKLKDCEKVGIDAELIHYEEDVKEETVYSKIEELNIDNSVTGFIVQLPLPERFDENKIIELIDPKKDVDGFSKRALVNPATPQGIIDYLEYNNFHFENANAVVIGRSNIVGRPIARMLLDRNCNVSIVHSKTSILNRHVLLRNAQLVIVATGHRNTITDADFQIGTMSSANSDGTFGMSLVPIYNNPFIVDVGINRDEDGKLCGDCEKITCTEKTPVPGGVGLLTRLALITNLLKLYDLNKA